MRYIKIILVCMITLVLSGCINKEKLRTYEIDLSKVIGEWESENEKETYYLSIKKKSKKKLEIESWKQGKFKKKKELLTVESIKYNKFTALTSDEKIRYVISCEKENRISLSYEVNSEGYSNNKVEDTPVGESKVITYLRKV